MKEEKLITKKCGAVPNWKAAPCVNGGPGNDCCMRGAIKS